MTTNAQNSANKNNAKKSSGPKTARGKAVSSKNAYKHGLSRSPDRDDIIVWYRIILNEEEAIPDPFEFDESPLAAFNLAEAEARLRRVRLVEAANILNPATGNFDPVGEFEILEAQRVFLKKLTSTFTAEGHCSKAVRGIVRMLVNRLERAENEKRDWARRLKRYRVEAEVRRHKAFNRWIEIEKQEGFSRTNPITP